MKRRILALLLPLLWEPVALGADHDGLYRADSELGSFYRAEGDPENLIVISKDARQEGADGVDEAALQEMVRNMIEKGVDAKIEASHRALVLK